MAKRKKRLEKQIKGIEKQILLHEEKIEKFGHEKSYLPNYWEKQIKDFKDVKKKREDKLKKSRKDSKIPK